MTADLRRQSMIFQIIALHLWRHPKHVATCDVCACIKTGRWP